MQVELELDIDRYSPKDRGYYVDVVGSKAWERREAVTNVILEQASSYVMLAPIWDYNGKPKADFTLSDPDNWDEIANCWLFSGLALHHRKRIATTARYTAALEKNQATLLGFHFAEPSNQAPVYLRWGIQSEVGQLVLTLEPGKKPYADLLDISQDPPYPTMTCEMSDGPILDADALYGKPFSLLCMPLRHRLLLHSDLWGDWFITPEWDTKPSWTDAQDDVHYYCLRDGQFESEADAIFYMAFRPLTYETSGQFDIPFDLPYTPTVMPSDNLGWETCPGTGAMLQVLRPDDSPYQLGDTEGKVRISLTGDAHHTPIINKLVVGWDPTAELRLGNPHSPGLLRVDEHLTGDPGADSMRITVRRGSHDSDLWQRPNVAFAVTVDGDTVRMTGLGDKPVLQNPGSDDETYEITLRSGWKRLEHALLVEGQPRSYDGMTFPDVVTHLLKLAGVDDSEIHVGSTSVTLPVAEDGKPPLYEFAPGTSVAQAIEQLRDDWASDWLLSHRPDGFHIEPPPGDIPVYTFVAGDDLRLGDPAALVHELRVWSDDSYFVNYLIVWGRDDEGGLIHSDPLEDLPSINDPGADDYVGDLRPVIIINSSANTVAKCNEIAQQAWPVWNHIPRFLRWRAPFVKHLRPHSAIHVETVGSVRILEMRTTFLPNLGVTDYLGEVL